MSFISLKFIIFFLTVLSIGYYLQKKYPYRYFLLFLLLSNYLFYSQLNWECSLLLLLLTIFEYYCSFHLDKKGVFPISIIIPIVLLSVFKYTNFFLNTLGYKDINIILPLGISFYTFELISYMVDIKKGKIEVEHDFLRFATYISFFVNIVSGPIERADNLLKQLQNEKKTDFKAIESGIQIMAIGYFKKMVLADRLSVFINDVYAFPKGLHWLTLLLGVFSYSLQIYMDFSGYSDIAIGCAKCLGFDLKKNFDLPYISKSVTEFWRRWHISLSTWFRDYVYIPLGGNRKGKYRQYLNLLIVMTLSGLWHGANWNYVLWGLINGILLCVEKLFGINKNSSRYGMFITFIIISFTWVIFRAEDLNTGLQVLKGIFILQKGVLQIYSWSVFAFLVSCIYILYIKQKCLKNKETVTDHYPVQDLTTVKGLTIFFVLISMILCLANANTNPFVYFKF